MLPVDQRKDTTVASKNTHNAAFVTGAVIGGLAGAAAALWKTPYSGEELREKITGGDSGGSADVETTTTGRMPEPTLADKVLSSIEDALAPVVGVTLGKTANGSGPETTMSSSRTTPGATADQGTTAPPANPNPDLEPVDHEPETGGKKNVTPVNESAGVPDRSSPASPAPASEAASVEDLTTPQTPVEPDALRHEEHEMQSFPKLGGKEHKP